VHWLGIRAQGEMHGFDLKQSQGDPAKRKKVEWKEFSRGFRAPILAGPTRTQYLGIWLAVLRQPEYVVYRFWKVET
jgi:hypothetical protein